MRLLTLVAFCSVLLASCAAGGGKRYDVDGPERVKVIASKVGPFANPSETYRYFSLPFCRPRPKDKESTDLSSELSGARKAVSPYMINFRQNSDYSELCELDLSVKEVQKFSEAIEDDYYYEMIIDDLPAWGYIGEVESEDLLWGHTDQSKHWLYTHIHFSIGYNKKDQIVSVNVTDNDRQHSRVEVIEGEPLQVTFSYSVSWKFENIRWDDRMDRYASSSFLPAEFEIHWLSIINSFILVILLTAFLTVVLMRVLKDSFAQLLNVEIDEEDRASEEDQGWKLLHGDVFRPPPMSSLLAAFVGAGAQLFIVTLLLLSLSLLGVFHPTKRGSVTSSSIFLYSLTSCVCGFVSARVYRQMNGGAGGGWVWNLILACFVFPVPLLIAFSVVNTIAIQGGSSAALPVDAILMILALFLLVAFPCTIVGGILGRNMTADAQNPCRTNKAPRELPVDIPWYRGAVVQLFMGGFLPFSAIYIELHYIFASLWGHKFYTLFGILFLAFVLLIIVTSFITVALTYFQLALEDYRWWWRSFLTGGAAGIFIYGYSFYYFNHSAMFGLLQTATFFGYMAVISYASMLMLGTVGFLSTKLFVHNVYSNIKSD